MKSISVSLNSHVALYDQAWVSAAAHLELYTNELTLSCHSQSRQSGWSRYLDGPTPKMVHKVSWWAPLKVSYDVCLSIPRLFMTISQLMWLWMRYWSPLSIYTNKSKRYYTIFLQFYYKKSNVITETKNWQYFNVRVALAIHFDGSWYTIALVNFCIRIPLKVLYGTRT